MDWEELGLSKDEFYDLMFCEPGQFVGQWEFVEDSEDINEGKYSLRGVVIKRGDKHYQYTMVYRHMGHDDGEWDTLDPMVLTEVEPVEITKIEWRAKK